MKPAVIRLPGRYGVYRLAPDSPAPGWARGRLTCITRSVEELSVLCDWGCAPRDLPSIGPLCGFVLRGPLDFALTGIIASVAAPLAAVEVSVFSIATYDTDYLLVAEGERERAESALAAAGFELCDGPA